MAEGERKKLTLAVVPLTGCGGCEVQVLRTFELYPELNEMYEVVYWPLVVEEEELPEKVDVVLVEGAVRMKKDVEMLRRARAAARYLIALGSCAAFGGINGQADYFPAVENMKLVYGRERLEKSEELLERVYAAADLVPVDFIISRCPPLPEAIRSVLVNIYEGKKPPTAIATVCAQCPRVMKPIEQPIDEKFFKKGLPGPDADPNVCFLSQGYLCLGPVTIVGCGAPCTRAGIPCFGCGGPAPDIAVRRDQDIPVAIARIIATLAGMDPIEGGEKVLKILEKVYGLRRFYAFTLESEVFRRKPRAFAIRLLAEKRRGSQG